MNRQRKVLITTTYNEMGIIIDTKAEELDLSAQQEEPSYEAVKEYCRKRCLSIVDSALLKKYASAQPERKPGKWIFVRGEEAGNALYMCSACGKGDIHAPEVRVPYCWNCGAEMTQDREVQYEQPD